MLKICHGGAALDFFNTLASAGFLPVISKVTRVQDSSASLIDNIFVNNISLIQQNGIIIDDTSDHFPIFATLGIGSGMKRKGDVRESKYIFDYTKISELNDHLVHSMIDFHNISDPEEACHTLIEAYKTGINRYSFQLRPNRKNSPIKPWITPAILISIQNRCQLFNVKLKEPTIENKSKYKSYRNILNDVIRKAKEKYIHDQLENSKHDTRKMWDTLLKYTAGKKSLNEFPNSFHYENRHIHTSTEIAESFNDFFSSIGEKIQQSINKPSDNYTSFIGKRSTTTTTTIQPADKDEIVNIIKNMKNVGSGFDSINAKIFKLT